MDPLRPAAVCRVLTLVGLCLLASCGSNPLPPTPPQPPPVGAPGITCPADASIEVSASQAVVNYASPVVTGGSSPVTTACTIPSGTSFPSGTSDVICTASDALGRTAQCVFKVIVTPVYKLRGTSFMAFGDSITDGETAADLTINIQNKAQAYPAVLTQLLRDRYRQQTITMSVVAEYGQEATVGAEVLRAKLATERPDALLLLEGVNDLNGRGAVAMPDVADALASDVRRAKAAGVQMVFLSTLLPQREGFRTSGQTRELIVPMNALIRSIAAAEGAVLVDNYAALFAGVNTFIGDDGLHPTVAGHAKVAETFFDAIKNNFEVPLSSSVSRRR